MAAKKQKNAAGGVEEFNEAERNELESAASKINNLVFDLNRLNADFEIVKSAFESDCARFQEKLDSLRVKVKEARARGWESRAEIEAREREENQARKAGQEKAGVES